MRSDAGSTAPTGSESVKLISCDFNVRNVSDDRHMCGRRHLPREDLIKPHRGIQQWHQRNS